MKDIMHTNLTIKLVTFYINILHKKYDIKKIYIKNDNPL